jgi:hypothetical protein
MSFGLLILLSVIGFVVFVLVLAKLYPGDGADLIDWDPERRVEARMMADDEDMEQMLAVENRRRRTEGLADVTEDDLRFGAGHGARKACPAATTCRGTPRQVCGLRRSRHCSASRRAIALRRCSTRHRRRSRIHQKGHTNPPRGNLLDHACG